MTERTSRRRYLRGAAGVAILGFAGCSGNGNGDGDDGLQGEDYPAIDQWLTETEVGGAADNYDGTVADDRDQDTVTVAVGAQGNGGNLAFGPPALVVSAGTEIAWSWTGEGGAHNVEAEPDGQLELSDYEFTSGEAVDANGVQFRQTLEETGVALYHCEPHLTSGMKGGIAVE